MSRLTPQEDAEKAYAEANDRAKRLRAEWKRQGRPMMSEGGATGRAPVMHPLLKAMNEAETIAQRLRQDVMGRKHRGPEPSAVISTSLGRSPASKLRGG